MPSIKMQNISTPHQEQYRTSDGNVWVTNFKRGVWQVMPRGHAPFLVGSKQEAFKQAIGIATRHWGRPKAEAFPPKRHHATKKPPAQLQREIDEVLATPQGDAAMKPMKGGATMKAKKGDHTRFVVIYYTDRRDRRDRPVRNEVEVASRGEAAAYVDHLRAIGYTAHFDELDVRP